MKQIVPWAELIALIEPHAPAGKNRRPPSLLPPRCAFTSCNKGFGPCPPAMEEAFHDVPLYREFAGLDAGVTRMPDESTSCGFVTSGKPTT